LYRRAKYLQVESKAMVATGRKSINRHVSAPSNNVSRFSFARLYEMIGEKKPARRAPAGDDMIVKLKPP
jgi:hypothetical protein